MGKGMLRNWQSPGAGRGGGGQEEGWVGGEMATGRGRLGGGNGDRKMGRGAMVRGETGKGRGEGATQRGRRGKKREDFTNEYDGMPGWT